MGEEIETVRDVKRRASQPHPNNS